MWECSATNSEPNPRSSSATAVSTGPTPVSLKNVKTPSRICAFLPPATPPNFLTVQCNRPDDRAYSGGVFGRSSLTHVANRDHGDVGDASSVPPPLQPVSITTQPSAAEWARTIAAAGNAATLATLTSDGDPWASLVAYGLLGGAPVLCVSNLAEHARNLAAARRASLSIVAASSDVDPLATGRITLAGVVTPPAADVDAARA